MKVLKIGLAQSDLRVNRIIPSSGLRKYCWAEEGVEARRPLRRLVFR